MLLNIFYLALFKRTKGQLIWNIETL